MQAAIETRELISIHVDGIRLRGTYHKSKDAEGGREPGPKRVGILFLNSGFVPRASSGDAAVYWAESFAQCGYPSFRFDLPGLGDSEGELPARRLDFARLVNGGHYAPVISTIAENLTERFHLSGMVLVGHCAGAVSAIYAAGASERVRGVLALDPYFFREEPDRTQLRQKLSFWVTHNKMAGQLSKIFARLKKLMLLVRRGTPPGNANLPLLRCWRRLASAGMPILILSARRPRSRSGEFDYLSYLQALSDRGNHMIVKFIEGTNHSFADNLGRTAVCRHSEQWLNSYFPIGQREKVAAMSGTR